MISSAKVPFVQTARDTARKISMVEDPKSWIPILSGDAWALGLDVPIELIGNSASEVLHAVDPELAKRFARNDILVAGTFGTGTSDERPVQALIDLGIGAIVANQFDPNFEAHALNIGLRVARITEALGVRTGDQLRVDFEGSRIANHSTGDRYPIRNADESAVRNLRRSIGQADA